MYKCITQCWFRVCLPYKIVILYFGLTNTYILHGYFVHTFQDEKITGCWILVSKVGIIIDVSARSRCGLLSKYWSRRRCNPRGLYLGPEDMKPLLVGPNGPLCTPMFCINMLPVNKVLFCEVAGRLVCSSCNEMRLGNKSLVPVLREDFVGMLLVEVHDILCCKQGTVRVITARCCEHGGDKTTRTGACNDVKVVYQPDFWAIDSLPEKYVYQWNAVEITYFKSLGPQFPSFWTSHMDKS